MSDSEDSESFLSADEGGEGADIGSSDITLSSDSEPEEGVKAKTRDQDSSDITLSSDDEKTGTETKKGAENATARRDSGEGKRPTPDGGETQLTKSLASEERRASEQSSSAVEPVKGDPSPFDLSSISRATPKVADQIAEPQTTSKCSSSSDHVASSDSPPKLAEVTAPETDAQTGRSSPARAQGVPAGDGGRRPGGPAVPVLETPEEQLAEPADWGWPADGDGPDSGEGTPAGDSDRSPPAASADREGASSDREDAACDREDAVRPAAPPDRPDTRRAAPTDPGLTPSTAAAAAAAAQEPKPEPDTGPPAPAGAGRPAPAAERRRPERRERRGPLKLGAKMLGTRVAPAEQPPPAGGDAGPPSAGPDSEPTPTPAAAEPGSSGPAAPSHTRHQEEQDGWGAWESWGTSLISSACDVTKTVLETVETGFGAPEPEELARLTREEQPEQHQKSQQQRQQLSEQAEPQAAGAPTPADGGGLGLGSWFGGVSRVLGQTSSLVVNTGLDTLEMIGKRTMDVLHDDQLGIHDTISQLKGQKPSLSQALREARQKRGDVVPGSSPVRRGSYQPPTFSQLFDSCDGTVHLEALEMLSSRTATRVTSARSRCDEAAGVLLDMIEDVCCSEELDPDVEVADFESELATLVARLSAPVKPTRLIIARTSAASWLQQRTPLPEPAPQPQEVRLRSVRAAAEMGAGLAEFLHKLAELRLVEPAPDGLAAARHLARLAALVSAEAGGLAARYAELLSQQSDERAAAATTDIYLETSYLQKFCCDALHLMTPVLQTGVLKDS